MAETQGPITPETRLTTAQAAALIGYDASSIINWCKQSHIAHHITPGGHRRILARDLVSFITKQKLPMPSALDGVSNV